MKRFFLVIFLFSINFSFGQSPDHSPFNELLKKHVSDRGFVNYGGFLKDQSKLDNYLKLISKKAPEKSWTTNQKLAYWINAYNAYTIKLILNHANAKLKSIKDIGSKIKVPFVNTPWDIKFIEIEGEKYDLNNIEHGIIRKQFKEPRIHFALVCAAVSCPALRNEAYLPEKLNDQLTDQATIFINDPSKNKISQKEVKLSNIFNWYAGDFDANPITSYLKKYTTTPLNNQTKISYLKYDWALNGKF